MHRTSKVGEVLEYATSLFVAVMYIWIVQSFM